LTNLTVINFGQMHVQPAKRKFRVSKMSADFPALDLHHAVPLLVQMGQKESTIPDRFEPGKGRFFL
jgi:hypothetical protein